MAVRTNGELLVQFWVEQQPNAQNVADYAVRLQAARIACIRCRHRWRRRQGRSGNAGGQSRNDREHRHAQRAVRTVAGQFQGEPNSGGFPATAWQGAGEVTQSL